MKRAHHTLAERAVMPADLMAMTVGALLERQAESHPDRPLIVHPSLGMTYGEADGEASRLAGGLRALGVEAGDHVAVLTPNRTETLTAWFATSKLRAVEVPLNPAMKGAPLEYLLNHSRAKTLFVDAERAAALAAIASRLVHLERVVMLDGATPEGLPWPTIGYDEVLGTGTPVTAATGDPSDLMAILYTSGTTGYPKGVMESHRCGMHWGVNYVRNMGVGEDDVNYLFSPLFHALSRFLGIVPALQTGSAVALGEPFSASRFWDICRRDGVTLFNFTGGALSFIWKQPARPDDADHGVRRALGAPIPAFLYPGFEERFGVTLLPSFGTSESNMICYSEKGKVRAGSSGRPIPEYELQIVDDDGLPVAPGVHGEIVTRPQHPDSMMSGYYDQPDVTVKAWRDLRYHTGDIGYLDEDGYLFFVDRKTDAIRRRGENISSFVIERAIDQMEQVAESAAVGIPSEHGEEEVKLSVVLHPGARLTASEIWAYCEQELPDFMVPRFLDVRSELPKTQTGRVRKFELRDEGIPEGVVDRSVHDAAVR